MISQFNTGELMTHWNYRVIKYHCKETKEDFYAIHEVHYEGEKIVGVSESPAKPVSESPVSLGWLLDMFKEALEKPVLDSAAIFTK
jgi:hypothetical protein